MKKILLLTMGLVMAGSMLHAEDRNVLISTPRTSLMVTAPKGGDLRFSYYGDKITPEQIHQVHDAWDGINRPAYPTFGVRNQSLTALSVTHADGNLTLDLVVENVERLKEEQANVVKIQLKDKLYPFNVNVYYRAYTNSDVIETWTEISHNEKKPVLLKRFDSGCLLLRRGDVWMSHLSGSWASEANLTTEPLTVGTKEISNMDGARNAHTAHSEVMFSLDGKPQENTGRVIGAALCWSGNYKLRVATEDNYLHTFSAGINNESSEYKLERNEVFITPKLAFTYSDEGLSGASRNFHRWARNGMIHNGWKTRDILLNSWEGVYLKVDEKVMGQMMHDIASMGGELFVMDDGWFGGKYQRNKDNSSLGDWVTDTRKLPNGIQGLIDTAKKEGIKFGIWIEPESTNSKSELFEKHPNWALNVKGRDLIYGRGGTQLLLDLTNPEVQDFIFNMVDNLLTEYPEIAYIKWDANTELKNYGSSYLPKDKQSHIYIEYHRGLEKVVKRIRAKYPDVVIQACGAGGGRVSYGFMPGFEEFWVSDNTDALQRIYMQWGTSYFYPSNAMGQHVSANRNHQTGRIVPLKFRFDVAMTGRLGMEIQPKDMSEKDKAYAKKAIEDYKTIRETVQLGNLYRLISPYKNKGVASLMYVNDAKDKAVFFAYKIEHFKGMNVPRFSAAGLDPNRNYRVREISLPDGERPCHLNGKVFSGALLMNTGFEVSLSKEYSSRVFELTAE